MGIAQSNKVLMCNQKSATTGRAYKKSDEAVKLKDFYGWAMVKNGLYMHVKYLAKRIFTQQEIKESILI